ncbi:MAG: acyl-CoA thioesterase [Salibacteraceae bacterium]
MMQAKTPKQSDTTITELMIPAYANFGGKIHGGILLGLMDKVAYACSTKHAGNYCVTVSVDGVDFIEPVEVGDLVCMMARVNYVGRTSLVVGIKVTTENVKTQTMKHTNTCYFTMVAKGDDGKPTEVPRLILEDYKDVVRFGEAMFRKDLKKYRTEQMNRNKKEISKEDLVKLLENERCDLNI